MMIFLIKKQNNEIILFNQECGAPVKRIGVESFESNKILDICSKNYDYLDNIDSSFIFQDNLKNKNNE